MRILQLFMPVVLLMLFSSTLSAVVQPVTESTKETVAFAGESYAKDELLALTAKEYEQRAGKKMKLKERVELVLLKHYVKKGKNALPFEINWGAFALGLLLGLIGLIITLFFKDKNAWKSALLGIGVLFVILLIVAIV